MHRRHTISRPWLIVGAPPDLAAVRRLQRSSGVLVLGQPSSRDMRQLRHIARTRGLAIVIEGRGKAVRVHGMGELRRALADRTPMVLLSPLYPTSSHPEWTPLPRMRAAALARLAGRRLLALGGMNAKRYASVAPLGFIGWAGISAFRT